MPAARGHKPVSYALACAALGLVALGALPERVAAATVAVVVKTVDIGEGATEIDQRLVFRAERGEPNRVRVVFDGRSVTVTDTAGVRPLTHCNSVAPNIVRCRLRDSGARAVLRLRDGDDVARVRGSARIGRSGWPVQSIFDGGAGDDVLVGGRASDTFLAGAGDDRMLGGAGPDHFKGGSRPDGSDTVVGGPPGPVPTDSEYALDEFFYGDRRAGINADLDGRSDDGAPGEHDRLVGVENLNGGSGADRLVGGDGPNSLDGGAGADLLNGGAGEDSLYGDAGADELEGGAGADFMDAGAGNDRIRADEGTQDRIECGFGLDNAALDELDFFVNEENYVGERDLACEQVARSGPAGLLFLGPIQLSRPAWSFYVVGCPGDAPRCDGTLTLLRNDQTLFTHSISLPSSTRASYFQPVPPEVLAGVPAGEFRGTVLISFVDPSGTTVEHRTAVTVTVL